MNKHWTLQQLRSTLDNFTFNWDWVNKSDKDFNYVLYDQANIKNTNKFVNSKGQWLLVVLEGFGSVWFGFHQLRLGKLTDN